MVFEKLRISPGRKKKKEFGCSGVRPVSILDGVCMALVCECVLLIAFLLTIHLGTQT